MMATSATIHTTQLLPNAIYVPMPWSETVKTKPVLPHCTVLFASVAIEKSPTFLYAMTSGIADWTAYTYCIGKWLC